MLRLYGSPIDLVRVQLIAIFLADLEGPVPVGFAQHADIFDVEGIPIHLCAEGVILAVQ